MSMIYVISSDEEADNDVVFLKEIHGADNHNGAVLKKKDSNQVVDLCSPPAPEVESFESSYRLRKLKSLKLGSKRHHTGCTATEIDARETDKLSSKYLKIDSTRLKELQAIVKIKLETLSTKSLERKKEIMNDKRDALPRVMLSPAKSKDMETLYPSPRKSQSTQKNLMQFLKSSPRSKDLENVLDKMSLSHTKTPSLKKSPLKTQSTLQQWVSPTKKLKRQVPVTPSHNINAKRNDVVWPPEHVLLDTEEFIKRLYKSPRDFPTTYNYLLESLQDEQLFFTVVQSINSFMSINSAPSADVLWYLVNNILSTSSDSSLISFTYALLNNILERYPTKCIGMKITWRDIKKYFFQDEVINEVGCKLVASFLLSVLSVEVKASALKSKQRRLTKYFSVDFDVRQVKDVIPHLRECLQAHTAATSNTCGAAEVSDLPGATSVCGLQILQNLLKLFMIVSNLNKENTALRLANELMYLYIDIPNVQERVLLLQTVTSHLVREQMIKVLLMNYCCLLPEALQGLNLPLSVRKILLQDFYREPPKRSAGFCHSVEDVEEYVTLLAYLLQSYVVIHSPSLHGYHNDHPLCDHDDVKVFSQEDLRYLQDLKFYVSELRKRCRNFLEEGQRLSLRTSLLLYMMEIII